MLQDIVILLFLLPCRTLFLFLFPSHRFLMILYQVFINFACYHLITEIRNICRRTWNFIQMWIISERNFKWLRILNESWCKWKKDVGVCSKSWYKVIRYLSFINLPSSSTSLMLKQLTFLYIWLYVHSYALCKVQSFIILLEKNTNNFKY